MNDEVSVCPVSNAAVEICQCVFCNINFVEEFLAYNPDETLAISP